MALSTLLLAIAVAAAPIDSFRWRDRLLLVFAARLDAPELARQRAIDAAGVRDRDLRIVVVVRDEVVGALDSGDDLRRRFGVRADEFRVVLIGKDGGIKLDERTPVPADRLFATIDAMPMRASEVRR